MITILMFVASLQEASQPQKPSLLPETKSHIQQVADSGRCLQAGEKPDQRVAPPRTIAPGQPPILSFRLYEGRKHGRFNNSELMLDDAGH